MYSSTKKAKEKPMAARTVNPTTQDWRTADPIWADDIRRPVGPAAISHELFVASAGFLALVASIATILA